MSWPQVHRETLDSLEGRQNSGQINYEFPLTDRKTRPEPIAPEQGPQISESSAPRMGQTNPLYQYTPPAPDPNPDDLNNAKNFDFRFHKPKENVRRLVALLAIIVLLVGVVIGLSVWLANERNRAVPVVTATVMSTTVLPTTLTSTASTTLIRSSFVPTTFVSTRLVPTTSKSVCSHAVYFAIETC